jgi:hypothetical protein
MSKKAKKKKKNLKPTPKHSLSPMQSWKYLAIFIGISIASFCTSISNQYAFDDKSIVEKNYLVKRGSKAFQSYWSRLIGRDIRMCTR